MPLQKKYATELALSGLVPADSANEGRGGLSWHPAQWGSTAELPVFLVYHY